MGAVAGEHGDREYYECRKVYKLKKHLYFPEDSIIPFMPLTSYCVRALRILDLSRDRVVAVGAAAGMAKNGRPPRRGWNPPMSEDLHIYKEYSESELARTSFVRTGWLGTSSNRACAALRLDADDSYRRIQTLWMSKVRSLVYSIATFILLRALDPMQQTLINVPTRKLVHDSTRRSDMNVVELNVRTRVWTTANDIATNWIISIA